MPDFDVAESAPLKAQLAAFARATDPADVDWANTDTLYAKPLWEQIRPQNEAIQLLSKRLAKRAADPRVAEALTRAVREQAANTIGLLVAMQVVAAGAPREALALIATWLDNHGDDTHRVATAAQAVLHLEPPTDAFAAIAPLLDGAGRARSPRAARISPRRRTKRTSTLASSRPPSSPRTPSPARDAFSPSGASSELPKAGALGRRRGGSRASLEGPA